MLHEEEQSEYVGNNMEKIKDHGLEIETQQHVRINE